MALTVLGNTALGTDAVTSAQLKATATHTTKHAQAGKTATKHTSILTANTMNANTAVLHPLVV